MLEHYLTTHNEFDLIHKELLLKIQGLVDSDSVVDLEQIKDDFKQHFAYEEQVMLKNNYPYLQNHIDDHAKELAKLTEYLKFPFSKYKLFKFEESFLSHIEWYDIQFSDWLKKLNKEQ